VDRLQVCIIWSAVLLFASVVAGQTSGDLKVADDLQVDLVLKDPIVANPLFMHFDARGRLWVVQYRQYPWPAGLKLISRDAVYRNVYDPPFPPPPPHAVKSPFRGKDRITIHEDTNGDGVFDRHKTFLDGLNLVTAALPGRGGVYVLNPPYLLYYADKDQDDQPDSDKPEILLSGFGIEDTHSISNSLRWGPDGWLYSTNGSTTSLRIVRYDAAGKPMDKRPTHRMGQCVWRYHPPTRRFEIFAEGGGNAFGVEIDSVGHIYSGHNGGNTRGFHYVQGGYFRKTFGKHGDLSNPFAFGHISSMKHGNVRRFTHTFVIHEAEALPTRYRGRMLAVDPISRFVVLSQITPDGSSRRTKDIEKVVMAGSTPAGKLFSPVDIQVGPRGGVYVADWHSQQINHYRNHEGKTDPTLGRIYRLRGKNVAPAEPPNLASQTSEQLIESLKHSNRWVRRTALRLLADRADRSILPVSMKLLETEKGQTALEALWAINAVGGFDRAVAIQALAHENPHVRRWAIRLIGDTGSVDPTTAKILAQLARTEPHVEVRSQLACSARRWSADAAVPIITALLQHPEDAADPHMPKLLWWAVESHAPNHDLWTSWFSDGSAWTSPHRVAGALVQQNLMRRWAAAGGENDFLACASLLTQSPDAENTSRLLRGFSDAFKGQAIPPLPAKLIAVLAKADKRYAVLLGVRTRNEAAIGLALDIVVNGKDASQRQQLIAALGDVQASPAKTVSVFLATLQKSKSNSLRRAILASLQKFDEPTIAGPVVAGYPNWPAEVQSVAQTLLTSRKIWAATLMKAVDAGKIQADSLDSEAIEKLRLYKDASISPLVRKLFPHQSVTRAQFETRISGYAKIIRSGSGNPKKGQALYFGKGTCGACHTLFSKGGKIGPDLTPYDRSNIEQILLSIVNPSAEIREGFENVTVTTTDGRILSGFKVAEDDRAFVLRGMDGQNIIIPAKQVKSRTSAGRSLMPEGLLKLLGEQELRDLFAYLKSTTPPK
jgi:putative membrane-bound dehydrogenase-like protein